MQESQSNVSYIVGYYIGRKVAQISYVTMEKEEVDIQEIPVAVAKRRGISQWFYGEDAITYARDHEVELIDHITEKAYHNEKIIIEDKEYEAIEIAALFIKETLRKAKLLTPSSTIKAFIFCVAQLDARTLELLTQMKQLLPIDENLIHYLTKAESLFYYYIHSPKEMMSHQVGVVDLEEGFVNTYRVLMNRNSRPIVTTIEENRYKELTLKDYKEGQVGSLELLSDLDEKLSELMKEFVEGQIVTCFYLTGTIFEKDWYEKTKKIVCHNRRVFIGGNLFSRGACLGGMDKLFLTDEKKSFIYLGEEKCKAHIGILEKNNGKIKNEILIEGGSNWFEAKANFTFIPHENYHLPIVIVPLNGQREQIVPVILPQIPGREMKTMRFECTVSMKSAEEVVVRVVDAGFGEFYKATSKVFEEVISLGGRL